MVTGRGERVARIDAGGSDERPAPAPHGARTDRTARKAALVACALPLLLLAYLAPVRWLHLERLTSWALQFFDVLGAGGCQHRLPPGVEFTLPAWLANLLVAHGYWLVYGLLSPQYLGRGAYAVYGIGVVTMAANLAAIPVLYAFGRRRGLSPSAALVPVLAYALCFPLLEKLAWDLLWPGGTFVFLAAWAAVAGRQALFWTSLALALGTHPLSAIPLAAWVWACRRDPARWSCAFVPARTGAVLVTLVALERVAFSAYTALGPRYTSWVALEAARIHTFRDVPLAQWGTWAALNTSWIVLLFASFGFLSLRSRTYVWLVAADVLYFLVGRVGERSSVDHGELLVTVAFLALAAADALARGAPHPPRRAIAPARWVAAGTALAWLAGIVAPHSRIVTLLPPRAAPTDRAPVVHEALAAIPREGRCATHSSFGAWLETRCRTTSFGELFPAAEGTRHRRSTLPPPDAYLLDLGRIAGQRSSPGFPDVQSLDGGCVVVAAALEEVRSRRCGTAWEREGIVVLDCTPGRRAGDDAPLASRLGELLASCAPAAKGLE